LEIRSRRLRLLASTAESVKIELEDSSRLADLIGARVPKDWPPESLRDALPLFAQWHAAHPDWTGWLGWYAIRLDEAAPVLFGSVGFKGPPDANGMAEIGSSVLPAHQRHGFATEMVEALVQWACAQPGVRCVEAETIVDNHLSVRVLERTGFHPIRTEGQPGSGRYRFLPTRDRPESS
jgi:ribosomal-protein-alanine N-acetyltransferase